VIYLSQARRLPSSCPRSEPGSAGPAIEQLPESQLIHRGTTPSLHDPSSYPSLDGRMVQTMMGGLYIDKHLIMRAPTELHIPNGVTVAPDLMEALVAVFSG
jgi:hypothetical protein